MYTTSLVTIIQWIVYCWNEANKSSIEIILFIRHLLSSRKLNNNKLISILTRQSLPLPRHLYCFSSKISQTNVYCHCFLFSETHDGSSIKCLMKIIASEGRRWFLLVTTIEDEQLRMDRITANEEKARVSM